MNKTNLLLSIKAALYATALEWFLVWKAGVLCPKLCYVGMCYISFLQVPDIRNKLSHMKLKNNLNLDDKVVADYFDSIKDMVSCLEKLHPQEFTKKQADNIRSELNDVSILGFFVNLLHVTCHQVCFI